MVSYLLGGASLGLGKGDGGGAIPGADARRVVTTTGTGRVGGSASDSLPIGMRTTGAAETTCERSCGHSAQNAVISNRARRLFMLQSYRQTCRRWARSP